MFNLFNNVEQIDSLPNLESGELAPSRPPMVALKSGGMDSRERYYSNIRRRSSGVQTPERRAACSPVPAVTYI